jgi:hypothetical protein
VDSSADNHPLAKPVLDRAASRTTESILADQRTRHLSAAFIPHRREVLRLLDELYTLLFPGFFGPRELTESTVAGRVAA